MLLNPADSFRRKSRLAISLSWVAGYTNIVILAMCGVVISHVTGNVTHFGESVARLHWQNVIYFAMTILMFLLGAASSGIMTELTTRRDPNSRYRYLLPMAVEALALTGVAIWALFHQHGPSHFVTESQTDVNYFWIVSLAAFAMGLQNATVTRISGAVVRTTHLTGVVTDLGLEGVQLLFWYWNKTRGRSVDRHRRTWRIARRHPAPQRVALLASILLSFLIGVIAGTCAFHFFPAYAMMVPVTFLLVLVWLQCAKTASEPHSAVASVPLR